MSEVSEYRKEKWRVNGHAYRRTPRGCLITRYLSMGSRCRNLPEYKSRAANFSRDEFVSKFIDDPTFNGLFNQWKEAGFPRRLAPSLDRIDNSRPYTLDNLGFLPAGEHTRKTHTVDYPRRLRRRDKTSSLTN